MKTKIIISILCLFPMIHSVTGQKARYDIVNMPIALPAADEAYGKDKRYKKIIPADIEKLAKRTDKPAGGFFGSISLGCPIDAKLANEKKGETPDIIFEVESPGIQNVRMEPGYYAEYTTSVSQTSTVTTKGYLQDIIFNFPMKLLVKDGQGNLKRSIIIADETEEFRMPYHAAFFMEKGASDPSLVIPATGFNDLKELYASVENTGMEKITMRAAKNQLEILFKTGARAIGSCYDNNYLASKRYFYYIKRMDGWNEAENADLSEAVTIQKTSLSAPYGAGSMAQLKQSLLPAIKTYENLLEKYGREVKPVRELCLHNLVSACYFSGDFENAARYYRSWYSEFGSLRSMFGLHFDAIFSYSQLKESNTSYFSLDFLKRNEDVVIEEKRLAKLEEDRRLAAEKVADEVEKKAKLDALRKELYLRGAGVITDTEGKKHEGIVAFNLISAESGILDLDAGRTVMLYSPQTDEFIRSFGVKDFVQVEVNGAVYSPVRKISRFISTTSILKLIYTKGKFGLYYDPGYSTYYIRSGIDDKAYRVADILKKIKVTDEFYAVCPAMKDQLRQEISDKEADHADELKKLVDHIAQLCP